MLSKIRNIVIAAAFLFVASAPLALAGNVSAADEIKNGLSCGVNLDASRNTACDTDAENAGTGGLQKVLTDAINIFSIIVGVIAVVMIIVGGLKYITSGGDSGNVSGAKNTIIYALVGLVIVALAQFIVRFVLNAATGATA